MGQNGCTGSKNGQNVTAKSHSGPHLRPIGLASTFWCFQNVNLRLRSSVFVSIWSPLFRKWQEVPYNSQRGAKMASKGPELGHFWPFLPLFGPQSGLGSPQRQGGTKQESSLGGQKTMKMCFDSVLDHLNAILVHFEPKLKIDCFSKIWPFWAILGLLWPSEIC